MPTAPLGSDPTAAAAHAFGGSIDAHADRCERHRWERASGGGKATRLLTDARQSLAKAAFPLQAGRTIIVAKLNEPCSRYIAAPSMKIIIHAVAPTVPAFPLQIGCLPRIV